MLVIFYLLSAFIIIFSFLAVSLKNILHSVLCLALALIGVAGIYILLNAEFLAAMQILIYVGAVVTLILFAIMLTHRLQDRSIRQTNALRFASSVICGLLLVVLALAISNSKFITHKESLQLGASLLTTYLLPFEVISLILLAALVGAIVIAKGER